MIFQTLTTNLTPYTDFREFVSWLIDTKLYWESRLQTQLVLFPLLSENMATCFLFCRNKYSKYGISTSVWYQNILPRLKLSFWIFPLFLRLLAEELIFRHAFSLFISIIITTVLLVYNIFSFINTIFINTIVWLSLFLPPVTFFWQAILKLHVGAH